MIVIIILLILSLIIQSSLIPPIFNTEMRPDFFLIFAFYIGISTSAMQGMVWGFIGGMTADIFSYGCMGPHTITLMIVGLVVGGMRRIFVVESFFFQLIAIAILTILQWLFAFSYLNLLTFEESNSVFLINHFFPRQVLLNIIIFLPSFYFFSSLIRVQHKKKAS